MVMGLVIHGLKYFVAPLVDMCTFVGIFTQTVTSLIGGAIIYIGIALFFKFDEVTIIREYIQKALRILRKTKEI